MTRATRGVVSAVAWLSLACGGRAPAPSAPSGSPTPLPTQALRIMPLGDSITQGNTATNSYRRPLWKRLQGSAPQVDFVGSLSQNHQGPPPDPDFDTDHEGHWGWRADQVLAEIEGWARLHRPDVVLLHLGSNDVFQGQDAAQTLDELEAIVTRLRLANPEVSVLLAQLIPTSHGASRAGIERLNAGIATLAPRLDTARARVIAVDHATGFDPDALTRDGVHPNAAGEDKMAAVWHAALLELFGARRGAAAVRARSLPLTWTARVRAGMCGATHGRGCASHTMRVFHAPRRKKAMPARATNASAIVMAQ